MIVTEELQKLRRYRNECTEGPTTTFVQYGKELIRICHRRFEATQSIFYAYIALEASVSIEIKRAPWIMRALEQMAIAENNAHIGNNVTQPNYNLSYIKGDAFERFAACDKRLWIMETAKEKFKTEDEAILHVSKYCGVSYRYARKMLKKNNPKPH